MDYIQQFLWNPVQKNYANIRFVVSFLRAQTSCNMVLVFLSTGRPSPISSPAFWFILSFWVEKIDKLPEQICLRCVQRYSCSSHVLNYRRRLSHCANSCWLMLRWLDGWCVLGWKQCRSHSDWCWGDSGQSHILLIIPMSLEENLHGGITANGGLSLVINWKDSLGKALGLEFPHVCHWLQYVCLLAHACVCM